MNMSKKIGIFFIYFFLFATIIFFGGRKIDYHLDEVWNYGLANHDGVEPKYEIGKAYSGMEAFEDFLEVQDDGRFNYKNVYENQANDVHPPLYYMGFHTVCSFFPNTFSKWYGIGFNMFWMSLIIVLLYKLSMKMTNNPILSMGIILAYGTTSMFVNMVIFIRMYTQFTFLTIALAYLFKLYWDKTLDRRFYILYSIIIIAGMLTHYYFLIYAFFFCFMFAIHLLFEKNIKDIVRCGITSGIDAVIYLAMWRHIVGHLLWGSRGRDSIKAATSLADLSSVFNMLKVVNDNLFAGCYWIFAIILFATFVYLIITKSITFKYEFALMYTAICFLIVVGKIAPYQDFRYISPVAFILVAEAIVVVNYLLMKIWAKQIATYFLIAFCLVINFLGFASNGFYTEMDFYYPESEAHFEQLDGKDCVILYKEEWETFSAFVALQHAKTYTFIDSENQRLIEKYNTPGYVWIISNEFNDVLGSVAVKNINSNGQFSYYEIEE